VSKFKIVLSDFHLGAGRKDEGNALEDFASDQEFADFVDQVIAESDRDGVDVEMVFNGDMFEMFQLPHVDSFDPTVLYRSKECYSSSEPDSVRKTVLAIAGHPLFFAALRQFIQPGPSRRSVTFVKGNHDIQLHWSAVQTLIRRTAGAAGKRTPLMGFAARCISREGIYIEHGNQYSLFLDRVPDMDEPFDPERPGYLTWPPGAKFVMDVFNDWERQRYWLDGVKPLTSLIWYTLAYDTRFALWAIPKLLRSLPSLVLGVGPDREDARAELARELEGADQVAWSAQYRSDPDFRAQFNAGLAHVLAPSTEESLTADQSASALVADPVTMGDWVRDQVHTSLYEAAERCAAESGAKVVVFGHTHEPGIEALPGGATYINTGTWTWSGDFTRAGARTWQELFRHPDKFANNRTLSFARIDYDDAGQPVGRCDVYEPQTVPPSDPESAVRILWQRLVDWFRKLWGGL
jgi:UDP-2,3-diacylglucosamine pyrophosphatase LpxH